MKRLLAILQAWRLRRADLRIQHVMLQIEGEREVHRVQREQLHRALNAAIDKRLALLGQAHNRAVLP